MKQFRLAVAIILATVLAVVGTFAVFPVWRQFINEYNYGIHKIDDATRYDTRKTVEDSCRAMQASYESDKQVWLQYRDHENEEKRGWADAALIRANKTAATYNQYVLKNSYVWEGNVPADIQSELPYLNEK